MKSVCLSVFQLLNSSLRRTYRLNPRLMVSEAELMSSAIMPNSNKNTIKTQQKTIKNKTTNDYHPHCGNTEPRKRIIEPLCGNTEPRKRIIEPLCGNTEPRITRIIEPNYGNIRQKLHCEFIKQQLNCHFDNEPLIKTTYQSKCGLIHEINRRIPALNSTRLISEKDAFIKSQNNMKAVINKDQCYVRTIINPHDHNEEIPLSIVRNMHCKHAKPRVRDREPSRIPVQKLFRALRKRRLRKKFRTFIKISTPLSSRLYQLVVNYKLWNIRHYFHYNYHCKNICAFDHFEALSNPNLTHFEKSISEKNNSCVRELELSTCLYDVSRRNIALAGDVELNPGPRITCNLTGQVLIPFNDPQFVFKYRLLRYRLRPLDVGGGGDCFFKSVSHQLYHNTSHHLEIRQAGIRYLNENPERFIESNTQMSWLQYITNMSVQGTWADHIIIQAVADTMNLKIHIIESDENFTDTTIVEPANAIHNTISIFIGHIGEMHYVSTCSVLDR